ncbi:MAG: hypothetical protein ACRDO8_02735 [Nocardioidaceae bacterium]
MTGRPLLALAVLVPALVLSGCGGGGDDGCTGSTDGEPVLQGVDGQMKDGNPIRIGTLDADSDPATVTFSLKGAKPAVQDTATDLQVGQSFSFGDVTYEVVGICPDKAYLDSQG